MTARDDGPNAGAPAPPTANQWALPKLRIDANGDWFDADVEVTHPGILANLRSSLRRDAQGYFIQTRVRIPVEVADVPFVVIRFERSAGDRKSTRLNSSHTVISYAVFCLKKKK